MKGLVSTIIPVWNRPGLILESVRSVLHQTYDCIEVIIVNDGSTDDTAEVVDRLGKQYPGKVHILHTDNRGPGVAREIGRAHARGDFIQYLDSDDILLPEKFERQVGGLNTHPECDIAYGLTRRYHRGQGPRDIAWKRTGERIDNMFPSFLQSRWWGTSTPLYRRRIVDKAGPWLPLWNEEDWEYDCRIAAQGARLFFCNEFVSDQRWDDNPRLSTAGNRNPKKLADRAKAHALIYKHAKSFGIGDEAPEMRHFAREVFLLSRQCGAAGLEQEAKNLFHLAREASEPGRRDRVDFRLYRILAKTIGWPNAGRLACRIDSIRSTIKRNE